MDFSARSRLTVNMNGGLVDNCPGSILGISDSGMSKWKRIIGCRWLNNTSFDIFEWILHRSKTIFFQYPAGSAMWMSKRGEIICCRWLTGGVFV